MGARNFVEHYLDYVDRIGLDSGGFARSAHNSYVQVAAETGLVGIVVVGAALALGVRAYLRLRSCYNPGASDRLVVDAVGISAVGFLCTSIFRSVSHPQVPWIILALAVTLCIRARRAEMARQLGATT